MSTRKGPKKVFISSTCLDLIDVRAELKRELEAQGFVAYTSETPDFPVNTHLPPIDNCLEVIRGCDIYVLVIHSRYGGAYDGNFALPDAPDKPPGGAVSVTLAEFLTARRAGLDVRVWVRDSIWSSRPVFGKAVESLDAQALLPLNFEPAVYEFIDYLQNSQQDRPWINQFRDVTDLKESIVHWLKEGAYVNEQQFKQEVVSLFQLLGYNLNKSELLEPGARRALARRDGDSFETDYAVWTFYSPSNKSVGLDAVRETLLQIKEDIAEERYERAYLVLSAGYDQSVADKVIDYRLQKKVRVKTYDDLLSDLIDFEPYVRRIVQDYEHYERYADPLAGDDPVIRIMRRCNLFKYFVPLRARSLPNSPRKFDGGLEDFISSWLREDGRNHLTLLGDFGTGKSSFALWLTYTLARRITDEGWYGNRIPVFISLRDHAGKIDIKEIVTNTLINEYNIRRTDFRSFERLLEAGRLLIIFDGFDETATLSDRASTLRILRSLNSLVRRNSKVILTCRSHYFRTDEETRNELNRSFRREDTELFAEQKGRDNFEIIQLREFRRDQIETFLERHYDGDKARAAETLAKMQTTYNLPDLSRRPVMLEMILKVWPRLIERSSEQGVTPALLYNEYVESWLAKVAKGNEDLMDSGTKRKFCEDLTRWMYRRNTELLPYTELEDVVRSYFADRPPAVYAALDLEIRTCTFLNRDSAGNYQFAHRSFMEFFAARACADELAGGDFDLLKIRPLSFEVVNFLRGLIREAGQVWRAIDWTRGKDAAAAGHVGGNAATLLARMGQSFEGADVERTVLRGADLTGADLTGARARGADLSGCRFDNATLEGADFSHADLTGASIAELGEISCLCWSSDGAYLAVGGEDASILVIDFTTRQTLSILRSLGGTIRDAVFFPDSNLLCNTGDGVVEIWDVSAGEIKARTSLAKPAEVPGFSISATSAFVKVRAGAGEDSSEVTLSTFRKQAFYSSQPRYGVILGTDNSARVIDAHDAGRQSFRSPPIEGRITTASFTSTDSAIAVGTAERKVYIFDTTTGKLLALIGEKKVNCRGLRFDEAKGVFTPVLRKVTAYERCTLAEWLLEREARWPRLEEVLKRSGEALDRLRRYPQGLGGNDVLGFARVLLARLLEAAECRELEAVANGEAAAMLDLLKTLPEKYDEGIYSAVVALQTALSRLSLLVEEGLPGEARYYLSNSWMSPHTIAAHLRRNGPDVEQHDTELRVDLYRALQPILNNLARRSRMLSGYSVESLPLDQGFISQDLVSQDFLSGAVGMGEALEKLRRTVTFMRGYGLATGVRLDGLIEDYLSVSGTFRVPLAAARLCAAVISEVWRDNPLLLETLLPPLGPRTIQP